MGEGSREHYPVPGGRVTLLVGKDSGGVGEIEGVGSPYLGEGCVRTRFCWKICGYQRHPQRYWKTPELSELLQDTSKYNAQGKSDQNLPSDPSLNIVNFKFSSGKTCKYKLSVKENPCP